MSRLGIYQRGLTIAVTVSTLQFGVSGAALGQAVGEPVHELTQSQHDLVSSVFDTTAPGRENLANALVQQKFVLDKEEINIKQALRTKSISQSAATDQLAKVETAKATVSTATLLLNGVSSPSTHALINTTESVRWFARPVWVVCDSKPWPTTSPPPFWDDFKDQETVVAKIAKSTGLLTTYDKHDDGTLVMRQVVGTAFVIGPHSILTNKHVVVQGGFAYQDVGSGAWVMNSAVIAKIEFPVEYNKCVPSASSTVRVTVNSIFYMDSENDFAIINVAESLPPPLELGASAGISDGDRLAVVGYPSRPDESLTFLTTAQIASVFGAPDKHVPFPAERISIGLAMRDETAAPTFFAHDATSWNGSSGSPIVSLFDGTLVGIQTQGLDSQDQGVGYNLALRSELVVAALKQHPLPN